MLWHKAQGAGGIGGGWDISTATYLQESSVVGQTSTPFGLFFKPDGTAFYVVGPNESNDDTVFQYSLSTAWDVSSASLQYENDNINSFESNAEGVFFKPDGTKMYIIGSGGDEINQFSLSTAWDVRSASHDGQKTTGNVNQDGLYIRSDGLKFFECGGFGVTEYTVSSAWNLTGTITEGSTYDTGSPQGVFFKPDGTRMFTVDSGADRVEEYALATPWSLASVSFVQSFSVSAQETFPTDIYFREDGLKMYIIGISGDAVVEYDLS